MSPGLVVPGVARYAVKGTYLGVPVANVLDMHLDVGGLTSRADAVTDQAKVILSNWADHICPRLQNEYIANEVTWVDMASSTGSTGTTSEGTGSDFPQAGGVNDAAMPGMVSYLVHKAITAARGSRQGRMFLPAVNEGATQVIAGNLLLAATITAMNTALQDFLSGINQESGVSGAIYDSDLVVVHTKNNGTPADPVIVFVSTSHVDALTVDQKVHTQRRRMG